MSGYNKSNDPIFLFSYLYENLAQDEPKIIMRDLQLTF